MNLLKRPRRNRVSQSVRNLVQENRLHPHDLIWPVFVKEGKGIKTEISSMPGVFHYSIDTLIEALREAQALNVQAVAIFPCIHDSLKNESASESVNENGLLQRTIRKIKKEVEKICVITDVAMDPYSSDGHDGMVKDGKILNDPTLPILAAMAVSQAKAGADMVACSDMMDGRVLAIREALDHAGFEEVLICSYCIKYASSFYGPFRNALDSAPRSGDKKTYQMNPANSREILREIALDESEGADILMVKPGLPYLDIILRAREASSLPIAAYHVSGEYAMLKAASQNGWLDYNSCLLESLLGFKRAGADMIFTYGAVDAARILSGST